MLGYYQNRLKRSNVMESIDQINAKCCSRCFVQHCESREKTKRIRLYCGKCDTSKMLRALGVKLLNLDKEENKFSKGEIFYLTHHLDVLGLQRGLHQVANRLERSVWQVEAQYLIEKEKSTRNMAV